MGAEGILVVPRPRLGAEGVHLVVEVLHLHFAFLLLLLGVNLGVGVALHLRFQLTDDAPCGVYLGVDGENVALMLGGLVGGEVECALLHIALALLLEGYLLTNAVFQNLVGTASAHL